MRRVKEKITIYLEADLNWDTEAALSLILRSALKDAFLTAVEVFLGE